MKDLTSIDGWRQFQLVGYVTRNPLSYLLRGSRDVRCVTFEDDLVTLAFRFPVFLEKVENDKKKRRNSLLLRSVGVWGSGA